MKSPFPSASQAHTESRIVAGGAGRGLQESGPASGPYSRWGKRAFDLACVAALAPAALVLSAPIAAWNAGVFRDPRRIFFVQERVGRSGRRFKMLKFRTMREPRRSAADSWFSGEDRARVTRFGRLLRNTHLDELPQLVNVLRGDMHLIGPRPEMPEVHEWACSQVPGFERRLSVRPGLTGRAQITQGYTQAQGDSYARKLAIDLDYIRGLSLTGDLSILARTVPWVLRGRGWSWNKGLEAQGPGAQTSASGEAESPADLVPQGATKKLAPRADLAESRS